MKIEIFIMGCFMLVASAANANTIITGDLRLSDGGDLVFSDGSVQSRAQVQGPMGPAGPPGPACLINLDAICNAISAANKVLPAFCSTTTLSSIEVSPANSPVFLGTSKVFTATGTLSDTSKQNLTTSVTWSSSNVSVATVSNVGGSKGVVTPVAEGTTTITATSGNISGTTKLIVFGKPSEVSATTFSPTEIRLIWTDNSNIETEYKIERKVGADGAFMQIATLAPNATSYIDTDLSLPATYYYRIQLSSSTAYSGYTNEVFASNRFIDKGNGTIYDSVSKLTWLKNANCFGPQSVANALTKPSTLSSGQCGLTDGSIAGDWRLPTLDELRIFVDSGYRFDSLNVVGFYNILTDRGYYSSTDADPINGNARIVNMNNGTFPVGGYTGGGGVWPIRPEK